MVAQLYHRDATTMHSACLSAAALMSLYVTSAGASDRIWLTVHERGIFQSKTVGTYRQPTSFGPINHLSTVKLVRNTAHIPAMHDIRFGVRYRVETASASPSLPLRLVTRFPEGGLFDPHIGEHRTASEIVVEIPIGVANYREFHLDHSSEIVPGVWIFEFWYGDRKIGEERFCLYPVEGTPSRGTTPPHGAGCADFIG